MRIFFLSEYQITITTLNGFQKLFLLCWTTFRLRIKKRGFALYAGISESNDGNVLKILPNSNWVRFILSQFISRKILVIGTENISEFISCFFHRAVSKTGPDIFLIVFVVINQVCDFCSSGRDMVDPSSKWQWC